MLLKLLQNHIELGKGYYGGTEIAMAYAWSLWLAPRFSFKLPPFVFTQQMQVNVANDTTDERLVRPTLCALNLILQICAE